MVDGVAGIGPDYKGPSYDKLRVNLLADLKRECQIVVDSYRSAWKEIGCTLMVDGWIDQRQRTLINLLVYCSKGLCFVKSVDASNVVKNASSLCDLFSEVIEWIGPDNIVHVVTNNAANYVATGRLINKKFENIHWSPCAAHCLNLILKDISSMPHIFNLATRASKITVFVYNHTVFLSWLRQRTTWKEIVHPGATRFATVLITLKSIFERKMELQALVVDTHFTGHKLGRSANGRAVSAIILDNKFWDDCFTACKIVSPLIKLMRLVDADDKPSLEIVYENEWWRLFGDSASCLQSMSVRILSQGSASSGTERQKRKQKVQYDPIDIESINLVDFWVTEEVVEKEPDLPNEIDVDLDQGGGGGSSSSTFYAAPLDFSSPSSGHEGDDINKANLQ
ncbi:uncharacterized protein LOC130957503 [Arachis stenosperma]|uniref:uncharacterized protein LOC130957503 n=1 Tax=Arachis stenosperma TaxID=217475 RepID=UPI0025AD7F61|nr:uncharacterized protein LOC130957503 [Arachis stenosperma]